MEHDRRHGARAFVERREQPRNLVHGDLALEPEQAGHEHELQLRHDRAFDADEQVVELAVLEVILDPGATDPADPPIDDDGLAMVDMPQPAQIPAHLPAATEGAAARRARLRGSVHTHHDTRRRQPVVELLRAALRIGALPVDDQPDRDALGRLRHEHVGEPLAHEARPEAELVDVNRRRCGCDVGEQGWVEVAALDVQLHRRGAALVERQRQRRPSHARSRDETRRVSGNLLVRNGNRAHAITVPPAGTARRDR